MERPTETGLFLNLEDLTLIVSSLKGREASLDGRERDLLRRMEAVLYDNLSIDEMEGLLTP